MPERDDILESAARVENIGVDLASAEEAVELYPRPALVEELGCALDGGRLHPVLVGEDGVGKAAIVKMLARAMAAKDASIAPRSLHGGRIIQVTVSELYSGALYANQIEHKVARIAKNCEKERAILLLEDLPLFLSGGSSDSEGELPELLTPFLRRGDLRIVGTATPNGLMTIARRNPVFLRLLTPLTVPETTPQETVSVLGARSPDWERRYPVRLTAGAMEEGMDLADRLYPWKRFPGKAVELLEAALSLSTGGRGRRIALPGAQPPPLPRRTDRAEVAEAVQKLTGLPGFLLVPSAPAPRQLLAAHLRNRVLGQDHVIDAIVERIQMIKARLCAPGRPLGAFLFAGPTGVGKTLVARTIAGLLIGDERRLIRFDMSEFCTIDTVSRFVGENLPRRRTYGLVDAALAEPFPIVLLDEVEKAHRAVFDVLLQVLGEGRLTDESGRTAHFTNALILMTSNLGSNGRVIGHPRSSSDYEYREARVREAIRQHFRPEFLNRITAIFAFRPLGQRDIVDVAQREVGQLAGRQGLVTRSLRLSLTRAALEAVVREGHSREFGARPMERAVDALVGTPVAQYLAERPLERNRTLIVDVDAPTGRTVVRTGELPPSFRRVIGGEARTKEAGSVR
ncbi:MAG: ATP-dependent Clp protease ATP-binding subunit [Deltaproteobacteria bacterium]|nr:ATP-dependent Clp protease ATP-binding subunit [Deltaproteobacteria bacterium]